MKYKAVKAVASGDLKVDIEMGTPRGCPESVARVKKSLIINATVTFRG